MKTIQTINKGTSHSEHNSCCGASTKDGNRQTTEMSNQTSARAAYKTVAVSVVACILVDQLSKWWAVHNLSHNVTQTFIPGLIQFTLTANTGAAFSLGSHNGSFMGLVAGVLTIVLVFWVYNRGKTNPPPHMVESIGMGLVLGGACGNLIDRIIQGQVTDFIEFAFMDFPIFNVADALIDIGIVLVFIGMFVISVGRKADTEPKETA
jgi:signal peptidase II